MSIVAVEFADVDWAGAALRRAPAPTDALIQSLIRATCTRLPNLRKVETTRIARLIEAGAFIDAALAIVACELPQWQLRRLAYDAGEWHCALSREPHMPEVLDDSADGHHENAALAILDAFLEARRHTLAVREQARTVPQVRPTTGQVVCVDNFA
jgi:hypothetical protein